VSVVAFLPPGLASLVVVSAFYSGSVVGVERAARFLKNSAAAGQLLGLSQDKHTAIEAITAAST
jgi:hypothetical protein